MSTRDELAIAETDKLRNPAEPEFRPLALNSLDTVVHRMSMRWVDVSEDRDVQ